MRFLPLARPGCLILALLLIGPVWTGTAAPAHSQEKTDAGTRQYAAAVALQNRGVYDLAADEWAKFIENFKTDPRVDRAYHYLGICQLKSNKPDQALAAFETVIKNYPKFEMLESSYLYLGVTQYTIARGGKVEMYDQAAETFKSQLTKFPKGKHVAQAIFYRAECLYARGKKKEAAALYAALVQKFPKHELLPDALYALGVTSEELDQPAAAGKAYAQFLKQFPKNRLVTEVQMREGETLFVAKQYKAAAERFAAAAAAKGFAMADHATVRQAASLAKLNQFAEAAALYASVPVKFAKSQYIGLSNLAGGKCYYLAGDFAKARSLLEKALPTGGNSAAEAAHWIARSLLKENKPADALAVVEKALPAVGKSPFAGQLLMDRADAVYEIPKRRGESAAMYAAVAAKYPKESIGPQALYMAGFAALGSGDYQASLKYANEFLAKHADDSLAADVTYVAAESDLQLNQPAEAEKLYATLLEKYPDHADAEVWKVRRALALYLQKKYQETIAALEPVLADVRTPGAVAEAQYLIGGSQAELKQYEAAVKSLTASLAADPKWRQADDTLLVLANAYRQLDDLAKAKSQIGKLIAQFPKSRLLDQAHYRLGEYCYAGGDLKKAVAEYRKVVTGWPKSSVLSHALYGLGWAELSLKDYAAADKTLSSLVEKFPNDKLIARARYARGMARQQLGNFGPAVEDLQAMLAADPSAEEKSDARYVLGLSQVGLKKYAEAVATFGALLKDDPKYAGADKTLYELAWALQSSGKQNEAAKTFGRLIKEFPESPLAAESSYHVGEHQYKKEKYQKAAIAYHKAMTEAGSSPLGEKATHKLGWAYFHLDKFKDAQESFAYQRATFPKGSLAADATFMAAECLFKQGQFQEALDVYAQVKNPSGENFKALTLLHSAQAAAQLKEWQKSLDLLAKCVEQFPDSPHMPQFLYEQGWAQQNLGDTDGATKTYEQVIAKVGEAKTNAEVAARAQFMIGEILFQKKKHADAVKAFFKVIYGYGYPTWQANASYEAARCFEVLGKKTQAIKLYQELIEKYPKSDKLPSAKERLETLGG